MSEKAEKLDVYDPNETVPSEAPPSYDEAVNDPSIPDNELPSVAPTRPAFQRPAAPPPHLQGSTANSSHSSQQSFQRPSASIPQTQAKPQFPAPTPINPNPYLPWRYPSSYRCSKCENMGYKRRNGHPCKDCWKKFKPGIKSPPKTSQDLERLAKAAANKPPASHKPAPNTHPVHKPMPNIVPLPPGAIPVGPMGGMNRPLVLGPGDPRIGGDLCPRCKGRGLVHFFLDLETCQVCNGLGRVFSPMR